MVGPSCSGKTYLVLKFLSRTPDRDIYIITKSPPEQYSNSKIKNKEIGEEIEPLDEYENAIIVFDDILGSSNSKYTDQYFIRSRYNNLDMYYLSQSCFDLPKKQNEIIVTLILFNQTLKDIKIIFRDVPGYDMSFDEVKQLCGKLWGEEYNYRCIDRSKMRDPGSYCICNGSKNTYK